MRFILASLFATLLLFTASAQASGGGGGGGPSLYTKLETFTVNL